MKNSWLLRSLPSARVAMVEILVAVKVGLRKNLTQDSKRCLCNPWGSSAGSSVESRGLLPCSNRFDSQQVPREAEMSLSPLVPSALDARTQIFPVLAPAQIARVRSCSKVRNVEKGEV